MKPALTWLLRGKENLNGCFKLTDSENQNAKENQKAEARKTSRLGVESYGAKLNLPRRFLKETTRRLVKDVYLRFMGPVTVVGHHNIPEVGRCVIGPSHRSYVDAAIAGGCIRRPSRFMAKDSMFVHPLANQFWYSIGAFPVSRGTLDRESLQNALEILEREEVLGVYPEGARQQGPRIKPILNGAVWLAAKANAPLIPCGIGGSTAMMGFESNVPKKHPVAIVFGEPFELTPKPGSKRVSRKQIEAGAVELRERMQACFDQAQAIAGTPNRAWSHDEPGIDDRINSWE